MSDVKRIFTYGRTSASARGTIHTHQGTWPQIVDLFREPVRRNISTADYLASTPKQRAGSKNTGLFFGGQCKNEHRGSEDLIARSIVNLDLDYDAEAIWSELIDSGELSAFGEIAYLVHTTRSHTDEHPKLRILVPLACDLLPAEYEPVARYLSELLDPSMRAPAREGFVPAQGMYFPSVSRDQDYTFLSVEGDFFDPATALAKYPADDASSWPRRQNETCHEYRPGRKMTHPEDKKAQAPIIAAVHRAYNPHDFIEDFLSDVYEAHGERYSIIGATGAPSVRIYDDAYVQSDHASDPANGQHNTFDLGRIHLFGDLDQDYDTESLSPAEWPSYKAMTDFMLTQGDVKAHLREIEAEIEAERNSLMLDLLDDLDDDEEPDDDDLIGSLDPETDDLIGSLEDEKPAATVDEVLRRARKSIRKATGLDDLERRLDIIRAFPASDFRDLHRDLIAPDIQEAFKTLVGETISKATARKMLEPTIEDLRTAAAGTELPDWLKKWVYLTSENKFMHLGTKQMLPREGFNGLMAVHAGEQFGVGRTGMSIIDAANAALSVFEIPKPYKTRYHPGKPELYEENDHLYANTHRSAMVPSGGYKGKDGVKLLKRLLTDLFPDQAHRAMIMDFIAHVVRFPEKKLKYALLIKGCENEGKSLLAMLMEALIGAENCSLINNDMLKDKFNSWSHERRLCVIEEIRMQGKEAHEVMNKLKPVITNPVTPIRRMQHDPEREPNFCNLFATTNYDDSIPVDGDNSRWLVIFTRFRTNAEVKAWHQQLLKEEGRIYTRDLWDHITQRPGQFLDAMIKYTFSEHYDPEGRAPDTVFKQIMAEDSKNEERQLLDQLLFARSDPTISERVLVWSSFRDQLDQRELGRGLRGRGVAGFLKPLGFVKAKPVNVREGGRVATHYVWTRDSSLLEQDHSLTDEGMGLVIEALEQKLELIDQEFESGNVVPIRGQR